MLIKIYNIFYMYVQFYVVCVISLKMIDDVSLKLYETLLLLHWPVLAFEFQPQYSWKNKIK